MERYNLEVGLLKVLAHPVRLSILDILRGGEQCVCHMEAVLNLRQAYISQQLMVLRRAGLVTMRREGWNVFYRVTRPEIYTVVDAVRQVSGATPTFSLLPAPLCHCPRCEEGSSAPIPTL